MYTHIIIWCTYTCVYTSGNHTHHSVNTEDHRAAVNHGPRHKHVLRIHTDCIARLSRDPQKKIKIHIQNTYIKKPKYIYNCMWCLRTAHPYWMHSSPVWRPQKKTQYIYIYIYIYLYVIFMYGASTRKWPMKRDLYQWKETYKRDLCITHLSGDKAKKNPKNVYMYVIVTYCVSAWIA